LFKKIKRIKTILKISNFDDDFLNNIVDDIDINVLNMSIHRLKLLKNEKLKQVISQKDYDKFMNIIHEDLRKMKLKTTDDLEDILNKLIKEKINI
jgi:predicted Ser/Thr protein kinase